MIRTMRAAIVGRRRLAEDELPHAAQRGVKQYVMLEAGLDTFAFRNPYPGSGLRTYEVNHPATQSWKQAVLARASIDIPESAAFVAVDFEKDSLAEKLQQADFRIDAPALNCHTRPMFPFTT